MRCSTTGISLSACSGHTVAQVALKWCGQQRTVDSVIIGAKNLKQLEDNMAAGDPSWQLSAEEVRGMCLRIPYIALLHTCRNVTMLPCF